MCFPGGRAQWRQSLNSRGGPGQRDRWSPGLEHCQGTPVHRRGPPRLMMGPQCTLPCQSPGPVSGRLHPTTATQASPRGRKWASRKVALPEVPRQGSEGSRTRGRRAAKLSTVCAGHARAAWRPPPRRPVQPHGQVPEPSSQQTVPGALGVHVQRNEADPDPVPDTKTNSKRIKDLNVRPKPVRLSGKSTRRKLRDTELWMIPSRPCP